MTTPNMDTSSMNWDLMPQLSRDERFRNGNPKDIEKILTWTKSQFNNIKSARAATERQWYLNLAFYFGKQNVVYRQGPNLIVGSTGNLYVPPAPYWRSRPVVNKIRTAITKEGAKLTAQKPNVTIVPATNDDRDLFAAQAGEQVWDSLYRAKRVAWSLRRTLWWTSNTGTGFMKSFWDPNKIDKGAGMQGQDQEGDICIDPVTPFHLFAPDFRAEGIEDQPFLIQAQLKSREAVKLLFPGLNITGGEKTQADILDDTWLNLIGASTQTDKNQVLCLEVWIKPGAVQLFPEGAMFTIVGDQVVQGMEGWPYEHGLYPYAKFERIPSGKFYADSVITDLIPVQREINRIHGQIIENKNRMAKLQLLAPKGSVDASKITTEPGQVIFYNPGLAPPQPMPVQSIPSYVMQELDRLQVEFDNISGQHEISRGQTPAGVTAGTAIAYLQEQDDSILSYAFDSLEEGIEKIAHMTLGYVQQFWSIPRMLRTVGNDGAFDVLTLKGSDLRSNNDIRVEAGSSLPTSKAAKMAFIMDLMKMGFIDPTKGLQLLEMGGVQKLYENIQRDAKQAQRENTKMSAATEEVVQQFTEGIAMEMQANPEKYYDTATGEPKLPVGVDGMPMMPLLVSVNKWDNHEVHIEEHNNYRKSAAYDALDDTQKGLFEEHVNQHIEMLVVGSMGAGAAMPVSDAGMQEESPITPGFEEAPDAGAI